MMKKVRVSSILLSVVFLIFVSTKVFSATYYVDPVNGTDNPRVSTGSKQSPFKTISRAASVAIKGDSIALPEGEYLQGPYIFATTLLQALKSVAQAPASLQQIFALAGRPTKHY